MSGRVADKRLFDGVLGEYRARYDVHAVVIYFNQADWFSNNTGMEFRNALRLNGSERDHGRQFWIDFRNTPDPGSMIAFTCREPHQWREEWPDKPRRETRSDTRPVETKLAEAEAFARRLEVEQKLDELEQRAFAAGIERGQIDF